MDAEELKAARELAEKALLKNDFDFLREDIANRLLEALIEIDRLTAERDEAQLLLADYCQLKKALEDAK